MYPPGLEANQFSRVFYQVVSIHEENSNGVMISATPDFQPCTAAAGQASHSGRGFTTRIECVATAPTGAVLTISVVRAVESLSLRVRGEVVDVPAGSFKLNPSVTWPSGFIGNTMVVSTLANWDLPATLWQLVQSGINSIPSNGAKDFGQAYIDEFGSVVQLRADMVARLNASFPAGVQVCGDETRPSCWRSMVTEATFGTYRSVYGFEASKVPLTVAINHRVPTGSTSLSLDPVFSLSEGQLVTGPVAAQFLLIGIALALLISLCFVCLCCYCVCCRKRKSQQVLPEQRASSDGGARPGRRQRKRRSKTGPPHVAPQPMMPPVAYHNQQQPWQQQRRGPPSSNAPLVPPQRRR